MPKKKVISKSKSPVPTAEYNKARRQLVLWSALLLVWEFIGVDLEAMKKGGGILGEFAQSLKNPGVVPWLLLVLVLYFFYRFIIEWLQFDPARQVQKSSQIDIVVSLVIALIAIFLSLAKHFCEIQFTFGKSLFGTALSFTTWLVIGVLYGFVLIILGSLRKEKTAMGIFLHLCLLAICAGPLFYMIIWLILNIYIIDPNAPRPLARIALLIFFPLLLIGVPFFGGKIVSLKYLTRRKR